MYISLQKQDNILDKRTSTAVESLLSLRAGTPVSEDNYSQWRPPSPASSVTSDNTSANHSPMQVAREEIVDCSTEKDEVAFAIPGVSTVSFAFSLWLAGKVTFNGSPLTRV